MSSKEKRDEGSKRMGQLLLQGWTMLAEACEDCDVPLMRSRQKEVVCVVCDGRFEKLDQGYQRIQPKPVPVKAEMEQRGLMMSPDSKRLDSGQQENKGRVPIRREEARVKILSNLEAKVLLISEEIASECDLGRLKQDMDKSQDAIGVSGEIKRADQNVWKLKKWSYIYKQMRQSARDFDKTDKILRLTAEEKRVKPDAQEILDEMNIQPEELLPRALDTFAEPGVTQDIQRLRQEHYESRRKGRTLSLKLSQVRDDSEDDELNPHEQDAVEILEQRGFSKSEYVALKRFLFTYQRQERRIKQDAHLELEREKEKARRWLRYKEGVEKMTLDKLKQLKDKQNKSMEKEKKVEKLNKEEEKKKKEKIKRAKDMRESAKSTVKTRVYSDFHSREEKQKAYAEQFKTIIEEKKKKEKQNAQSNFEKMNERIKTFTLTSTKWMDQVNNDQREVDNNLKKFEEKMNKSMQKNLQHRVDRIRAASAHVQRVNQQRELFIQKCTQDAKDKLQSYIAKHQAAEERRAKISKEKQKDLDKHKKKLDNRFQNQKYKQHQLERDILEKNSNLLQKLEEHDKNVEETRKNLQQVVKIKEERDKLKKYDQIENFEREKRNYERFKFSVMNKHQSIDRQVELLKDTKQELINYKLKRDIELKKHGSLRIPNPFDVDPSQLTTTKMSPDLGELNTRTKLKAVR